MALEPKTYSDGPSDEMNARMDQDLTNFKLPVIVSPDQSGYRDKTPLRGTISPPSPNDSTPPRSPSQQLPVSSRSSARARSTEPRSSSRRPPRQADAQMQRPRSSSSRRRSASGNRHRRGTDEDSHDGSFASSGSEVIDDLNALSDFLRERREAKRAQRSMQQQQQQQSYRPRR